jgi:hypothetical protein
MSQAFPAMIMHLLTGLLVIGGMVSGMVKATAVDPPFGFPTGPAAPKQDVVPPPSPGMLTLTVDNQLVVQFKDDRFLMVRPEGLVKVVKEAAPFNTRGKFADGTGLIERRLYQGPTIYTLEVAVDKDGKPLGSGLVYIDAVLVGGKSSADVTSTVINVVGGQGPQPPPPGPDVNPKVDPVVVKSFRAMIVYDNTKTYPAATTGVIYSQAIATFLDANTTKDGVTPGWRRYPKTVDVTNEFPTWNALWTAVKPQLTEVPCLVIEVNGKADILPLPATETEALATLKRYLGGK